MLFRCQAFEDVALCTERLVIELVVMGAQDIPTIVCPRV